MALAGGKNIGKLEQALTRVPEIISDFLNKK
jgi:hypothetical protein